MAPFIQEGHFLRIPVNDNYNDKLLPYFHDAFQFLGKWEGAFLVQYHPHSFWMTTLARDHPSYFSSCIQSARLNVPFMKKKCEK